ncbi:olfactory receptor 13G1-like [Tachyglossus aculeatus]|uniref:olfactory receptor 13G1-like n=1 Tax=Tachyglossus aculeatus TaxID=9261 RepID=UPI0018F4B2A2|nr:olfactory receptor 13G1-like [Tachyglossus aculeatus]
MVAVLGSYLIVSAVSLSAALHTPMYVPPLTLAPVDVVHTSSIVPRLLGTTLGPRKAIIYGGCMSQFFFTCSLESEMVLFTTMAYDHCAAICFSLLYATIMSRQTCPALLAALFLIAVTNASVHMGLILRLTFGGMGAVDHFFCEIRALQAISSTSVQANEVMVFMADIALSMGELLLTCLSYSVIVAAILHIPTTEGKRKAFSN